MNTAPPAPLGLPSLNIRLNTLTAGALELEPPLLPAFEPLPEPEPLLLPASDPLLLTELEPLLLSTFEPLPLPLAEPLAEPEPEPEPLLLPAFEPLPLPELEPLRLPTFDPEVTYKMRFVPLPERCLPTEDSRVTDEYTYNCSDTMMSAWMSTTGAPPAFNAA